MVVRFDTAIGDCSLAWSERGLTGVWLPRDPALAEALPIEQTDVPEFVAAAADGVRKLFAGARVDLREIPLDDTSIEDFQRRVLWATRAVDPGQTTTYGAIARSVGTPNDARAVGAALGRNPWPIVVPCHRVLAADGALHGFSAPGGLVTKRRMLEIERAPGFDQPSLFAGI